MSVLALSLLLKAEGSVAAKTEIEAVAKATQKLGNEAAIGGGKGKAAAAATDQLGAAARRGASNLHLLTEAELAAAGGAVQLREDGAAAAMGIGNLGGAFNDLGPLVGRAAGSIVGALISVLNPVNLLIGAAIGAGNAMVSWFFSSNEAAADLKDGIDDLDAAIAQVGKTSSRSWADMRKDMGAITPQIVAMQRELLAIDVRRVAIAAAEARQALVGEMGQIGPDIFGLTRVNARQVFPAIDELKSLFVEIGQADGLVAQADAASALAVRFDELAGGVENMNAAQLEFYGNIVATEQSLRAAAVATGEVSTEISAANDTAGSLNSLVGDIAASLGIAAGVNLSGVFSGAFGAADTLLGKAQAIATTMGQALADFAAAPGLAYDNEFAANTTGLTGPDGARARTMYGAAKFVPPVVGAGARSRSTSGGGGGGGGGAAAARDETSALQSLIASLEDEIAALRIQDPIQQEMLKHREALAGATDIERQKVEELIATREREAAAMQSAKELSAFFEQTGLDALDALIFKGESFNDVLKTIIQSLIKAAAQALIFGTGPFGGLFGGKSILSGLFPALGGKADGGMIFGAGDGRSDSILTRTSVGEFVVNAKATSRNRQLLEAINAGGLPGYANGGAVGGGRGAANDNTEDRRVPVTMIIDARGARGNEEIQQMVRRGVEGGLAAYDRQVLPGSLKRVSSDQRRVG